MRLSSLLLLGAAVFRGASAASKEDEEVDTTRENTYFDQKLVPETSMTAYSSPEATKQRLTANFCRLNHPPGLFFAPINRRTVRSTSLLLSYGPSHDSTRAASLLTLILAFPYADPLASISVPSP